MVQRRLVKIGRKDGPGYVVMIGKRKYRTYARTSHAAKRWADHDGRARVEALRNGDPAGLKSPEELFRALKLIVSKREEDA
jgi:hypothetical protein